jgi:hypothetical protein
MVEDLLIQRSSFELTPIEDAILKTVIYSDIFSYPVTPQEIHRYLIAWAADPENVHQVLNASLLPHEHVASQHGYFFLPGREALVSLRQRRAQVAQALWQHACDYGRWIARLPFVRMVAVTGALAVDNVDDDADIDYLIVTEPGRLWLCRALVIALVRWAEHRGHVICPNYFLSERALVFNERNLYTAREVAQMVPIAGRPIYDRMRRLNPWVDELLPNAQGPSREIAPMPAGRVPIRGWIEHLLRTPAGEWLEVWEMNRKIRKFERQVVHTAAPEEAAFCAEWCKGHFDGHAQAVLHAFAQQLEQTPVGLPQQADVLRQEQ